MDSSVCMYITYEFWLKENTISSGRVSRGSLSDRTVDKTKFWEWTEKFSKSIFFFEKGFLSTMYLSKCDDVSNDNFFENTFFFHKDFVYLNFSETRKSLLLNHLH